MYQITNSQYILNDRLQNAYIKSNIMCYVYTTRTRVYTNYCYCGMRVIILSSYAAAVITINLLFIYNINYYIVLHCPFQAHNML